MYGMARRVVALPPITPSLRDVPPMSVRWHNCQAAIVTAVNTSVLGHTFIAIDSFSQLSTVKNQLCLNSRYSQAILHNELIVFKQASFSLFREYGLVHDDAR